MIEEFTVDEEFIEKVMKYRSPESLDMGLIEACSKNVNLFADKMIGIKTYAWQAYVLHKAQLVLEGRATFTHREFVWLTSRQVGKSLAIAILCTWATVFNKAPGGVNLTTDVGIVSASDTQAKKLLYEMKKILHRGDRHMEESYLDEEGNPKFGARDRNGHGFFTKLLADKEPNNTTTITFKAYDESIHGEYLLKGSKSGSVIKSYPPSASVLGETFSILFIDEAGKTERISDQFFYDYIYPTGNEREALRIYASTPWTQSGFFFEMCSDETHPAEIYVFTIEAVAIENPRYYNNVMKIVDQMNKDGKTDEVQRAYYCRFVQGDTKYFNPDKVLDVFDEGMEMMESYPGLCDMGVDFGAQKSSETVITITRYDETSGAIQRLFHHKYPRGTDLNIVNDIEELMKRFNVQRIIPDDCPAGAFIIEEMKQKGWEIHPMDFRSDKVKKYSAFRSSVYKGLVKSYPDDALLVEMRALENSQTSTQSKIVAPKNYSDDLIDSFVMSAYFFVQEEGGFDFYSWDDIDENSVQW